MKRSETQRSQNPYFSDAIDNNSTGIHKIHFTDIVSNQITGIRTIGAIYYVSLFPEFFNTHWFSV